MLNINSLPSPDNPDDALAAVVALRLVADKLERKSVTQALLLGWTWAQIAEALGITKQAAHKRHANYIKNKKILKRGGS